MTKSASVSLEHIDEAIAVYERNKRLSYYPDTGPLRRELYPKHIGYFEAGARHRERLFLAANRVGKTEGVGAYEVTCHATGLYPEWWEGRRFDGPIRCWAAGDNSITVRDIIQAKMFGPKDNFGTGMVPAELIIYTRPKRGVPDALDLAYIRHVSGKNSLLIFKSFDQGRESFQGTEQDVIWLDEEPPYKIYSECITRTMTTNGLVLLTFTPLQGLTDLVESFLLGGRVTSSDAQIRGHKYMVPCTWEEVPHLDDDAKAELLASYLPYERKARSKGIPSLGAGAIYPVDEEDIVVKPFAIPDHWPRAYGLDVGWKKTAAIWAAQDPETQKNYLYDEHYRGETEPVIHVEAIKGRSAWIPGVIDPAARSRGQKDGLRLFTVYERCAVHLLIQLPSPGPWR